VRGLCVLSVPELEKILGISVYATKTVGVGGVIRKKIDDFVVEEILTDGSIASVNPSACASRLGRYLVCILVKRNWDTILAVKTVAQQLKISSERISFAGIKDTKALTAQHISFYGVRPEEISRVRVKDVNVFPVRYADEKVSTKLLFGNQFTVTVRSISLGKNETEKLVRAMCEEISVLGGVPNFFGHQRFGTVRPITHLVGRAVVMGDLEEATMIFLSRSGEYEHPMVKAARERLAETGDFKEALSCFPRCFRYERLMLRHLVVYPRDFLGAFRRLPLKLRELFVQAYQSYLFNQFLSERISQGLALNEVYVGDYVVGLDEHGLPAKEGEVAVERALAEFNDAVRKGKACVAVPFVGFKQSFSDGLQGEIERTVLEREKINSSNFKSRIIPEISAPGGLRAVLTPVMGFAVEECGADSLASSCVALRLRFVLRRGSYATILLREFMKPQNPVEAGF
jgi:tRNA pseudouridine13 synthase